MSSSAASQISNVQDTTSETRKTSKVMNVKVIFLDNSSHIFQIPSKTLGQQLFDKVCKHLNLLEIDYFGLEYADDKNTKYWLDVLKPMCRQTSMPFTSPTVQFCVKFYTPDPLQLEDEYTRYLFSLQIKKDLAAGLLQCNDNTAALMVSYIIQADCGDYDDEDGQSENLLLASYKFVPFQDAELGRRILENRRKHLGQTPAEAELNLLETARRCELYGIRMTPAKDHEGVPLNLAVAHLGVLVFQNFTKINTFSWAKIRKLSFKRKRFLIKLHPEGYGYYKDTVEFFFEGRNECKNFWKKCIENHTFFRCNDAKAGMRQKPKIFSRGSSFRYSGRTQKQVSDFVRENYVKRQPFQRSTSLRTTPSSPIKAVGSSVSAQPLLPMTTSMSCGSVADVMQGLPLPENQMSTSEPATPHLKQDTKLPLRNGNVVAEKPHSEEMKAQISSVVENAEVTGSIECISTHDLEQSEQKMSDAMEKNSDLPASKIASNLKMNCVDALSVSIPSVLNQFPTDRHEETNRLNDLSCVHLLDESISELYQKCVKTSNIGLPGVEDSDSKLDKKWGSLTSKLSSVLHDHSSQSETNKTPASACVEERDSTSSASVDSDQTFGRTLSDIDNFTSIAESHFLNQKRVPSDEAYFIAKELLMTERTYRRDLEMLNVVFRDEFNKQGSMPTEAVEMLLSVVDPLYEVHCSLLRELEQQMAIWEGRPIRVARNSNKCIGQILLNHCYMTKLYDAYEMKLSHVLELLTEAVNNNQRFADFYQKFEMHKMCYIPLTSFLLRPLYRVFYYSSVLQGFIHHYGSNYANYKIYEDALKNLHKRKITDEALLYSVVNYVKLAELQRNLMGFENILNSERTLIREGCLQKLSRDGNQQMMFFLFSDVLLCASQVADGRLYFKVQGHLPLHDLKTQSLNSQSQCFSISRENKTILLSASSEKEKCKWLKDLSDAITSARNKGMKNDFHSQYQGAFLEDQPESESCLRESNAESDEKSVSSIVNTTVHVCWHRNISVGQLDLVLAAKHFLSGYLLRKFKNNSGWQKLWVVLSNLCLFFYKTHFDDCPLANLPLAGYKVDVPSQGDSVTKDCVFKLQYKSHSYFFQAESQHTLNRWMEVIGWSTLQDGNPQL